MADEEYAPTKSALAAENEQIFRRAFSQLYGVDPSGTGPKPTVGEYLGQLGKVATAGIVGRGGIGSIGEIGASNANKLIAQLKSLPIPQRVEAVTTRLTALNTHLEQVTEFSGNFRGPRPGIDPAYVDRIFQEHEALTGFLKSLRRGA